MEDDPHARYPLVGEELADFRGTVYAPVLVRRRAELPTRTSILVGGRAADDALARFGRGRRAGRPKT